MLFTTQSTPMVAETFTDAAVAKPLLQTASTAEPQWRPAPLDPTWVVAGNPVARVAPFGESADHNFSYGLWDCTDGEFHFHYFCDEIIHILEGDVTIRVDNATYKLGAGSVAFFPKGMTAHWTVHGYVRKLAIFRTVQGGWLRRMAGKARRWLQTNILRRSDA